MPPRRRQVLAGNVRLDRAARAAARATRHSPPLTTYEASQDSSSSESDSDYKSGNTSSSSSSDLSVQMEMVQRELSLLRRENALLRRERELEVNNTKTDSNSIAEKAMDIIQDSSSTEKFAPHLTDNSQKSWVVFRPQYLDY